MAKEEPARHLLRVVEFIGDGGCGAVRVGNLFGVVAVCFVNETKGCGIVCREGQFGDCHFDNGSENS